MRRNTDKRDRSVSVALNYILVLAISTVLVTGILLSGGNFVEDNRERVIESELTVIGHHIAGNMEQVDRLANASQENLEEFGGDPDTVYVNQSFQQRVTGSSYRVELVDNGQPQLRLVAIDPGITVDVNLSVSNDVRDDSSANPADISVYYDPGPEELVIDDA